MGHLSYDELAAKLQDAVAKVTIGATYRHFKNADSRYKVLGFTILEATDEVAVRYHSLEHPETEFSRVLENWLQLVEKDGRQVQRFSQVES